MKKTLKAAGISLTLALTTTIANAAENIAFINAGYIFQNHPARKSIADKFNKEFKAETDKLTANKKNIDNKIAALKKDAPRLRSADIKKREKEINNLIDAHQKAVKKFQQKSDDRQNQESARLLETIQVATNQVAKEKNYTLVLDANAIVFAADSKDISDDVLKALPTTLPPASAKKDKAAEKPDNASTTEAEKTEETPATPETDKPAAQ